MGAGDCVVSRGKDCAAHVHRSAVAQERHHLQPKSRGGLDVATNLRMLCANAHGDTHYLLDEIEDRARELPAGAHPLDAFHAVPTAVRRTYGAGVIRAALDGWSRYGADYLAGRFARRAQLWHTSGQPRVPTVRMLGEHRPELEVLPYAMAERLGHLEHLLDADLAL
jgi:hypothetical protein